MHKVVVIGGNAAGVSAAAKLRRLMPDGVSITALEKSDVVSYAGCGLPYYVSGHIDDADNLIERTAEQFGERDIEVRLRHRVTSVDLATKVVRGKNVDTDGAFDLPYETLIVASGARVRRIPPFTQNAENLFEVRTVDDAVSIRQSAQREEIRRVVVVGAGFIGLEMAEALVRQGKKVLLVEFATRVLTALDPEITDKMTEELVKGGVEVRTDAKVTELGLKDGRIASATVETGGKTDQVAADMVVNCVGIVPNAEFIDVDKALNGAIIVDDRMRTSAPDVYAAGDCSIMKSFITRELLYAPLGTNANKQGRIIAEQIAGLPPRPFKLIGSSAIRLFDLDVAKVGLSEGDAQRLNLDYKTTTVTANSFASYYGSEKLLIKLVYCAKTGRLFGAQTVGMGVVVPRANYFAIAIAAGMTAQEFAFLDLCYSPPFSGVWDASLIAAGTAK
ncbi:MAG: FAD-dependent oxidoreductase [Planctomycetaceae bacterium]|nr:FAD-dependent oxidoreductase [Planctomycetaceae bacterium]